MTTAKNIAHALRQLAKDVEQGLVAGLSVAADYPDSPQVECLTLFDRGSASLDVLFGAIVSNAAQIARDAGVDKEATCESATLLIETAFDDVSQQSFQSRELN